MSKQQKKTTVYLPLDIDEGIRQSSKMNKRSYNSEIIWALEQYLEQQKGEKHEKSIQVPPVSE